MSKANRICKTCGKAYFYCNNCNKKNADPQWMLMWDTENCKNVFEIVSNYAQKVDSKAVAKKKLSKCDLSKQYTFNEKIRDLIDEIMFEEKSETKVEKKVEVKEVSEPIKTDKANENEESTPKKKGGLFSDTTEDK